MMKGLCYLDDEKIAIKDYPIPEIEEETSVRVGLG